MEEPEIFEARHLPLTAIRAQDADGKWGSFTFAELLATGHGQQEIIRWFGNQLLNAAGVDQTGAVDETAAVNLARIREVIVGPLAKLKPDVS